MSNDKYDRQVRLWNTAGQRALHESSVALVNISTLAAEALKNIVLPGVGTVTILDAGVVDETDVAANFFYTRGDLAKSRAAVLASVLQDLNPDVSIHYKDSIPPAEDVHFWSQFHCVLYTAVPYPLVDASALFNTCWDMDVPVCKVGSLGFYAYLKIQLREHAVVESHGNNLHDLRLDFPWPELQAYLDSVDIDPITNSEYYKIPFSVILTKLNQEYVKRHGTSPTTKQLRNSILDTYKTMDDPNVHEAYKKAYLIMKQSSPISDNIKEIFSYLSHSQSHATTHSSTNSLYIFQILAKSLKCFYEEFGVLPISGVLPDMESDTNAYLTLKKIYLDKFNSDKSYIRNKAITLIDQQDGDSSLLSDDTLVTFVRNARYLKIITGTKIDKDSQILQFFRSLGDESLKLKALIYLAFLIVEQFARLHGDWPTWNNRSELRALSISILCNDNNIDSYPENLDKILDELCRAFGNELHNISAIFGGVVAQEVIKLLTNQYVPVDNCVVLDGILGKTSTFKL